MILREGMTKLTEFMQQKKQPNPTAIAGFVEHEIAPDLILPI